MKELLNRLPHKANKFKANVAFNHTSNGNTKPINRFKDQLKSVLENYDKQNQTGTKDLPLNNTLRDFFKRQQSDHIHKVRETNIGNHETENIQFSKKTVNKNR